MAYFCDLAGHETAKVSRRGADFVGPELPGLRAIYASVYQTVVRLYGHDPDNDQLAYGTLRALLVPGGVIPIAWDARAYEHNRYPAPAGLTILPAHLHFAQYLGILLGGLARSIQSGVEHGEVTPEEAAEDPPAPRRDAAEATDDLASAFGQLAGSVAADARERLARFVESVHATEQEQQTTASVTPAAIIDAATASAGIDLIGQIFAGALRVICPEHNIGVVLSAARDELVDKMPLALVVSALGSGRYYSSRQIGNHVHRVIQHRYEVSQGTYSDIISEMFDPSLPAPRRSRRQRGAMTISVLGPTTRGRRENLLNLMGRRDDPHNFFRCAHTAYSYRVDPFAESGNTLRPDLMDKRQCYIWEIKPVRGAVAGVIQEVEYRLLFNLTREVLTCLRLTRPPPLEPGRDIQQFTNFSLAPVDVASQAGEPALAVPFQILPTLGSLVLYFVFRAVNDATVLVLIRQLQRELTRRQREERRQQRERERGGEGGGVSQPVIVYQIDWEQTFWFIVLILVIILIVMLLAPEIAAAAAVLAALAALGIAVGTLPNDLDELGSSLGRWTRSFTSAGDALSLTLAPPPGSEPRQQVRLNLSGLCVDGLPADTVATLWRCVDQIYPAAKQLQERYMRANVLAISRAAPPSVA